MPFARLHLHPACSTRLLFHEVISFILLQPVEKGSCCWEIRNAFSVLTLGCSNGAPDSTLPRQLLSQCGAPAPWLCRSVCPLAMLAEVNFASEASWE